MAKQVDLIRLTPILEIIKAAIWTGRVLNEKPVSIMLVAEQESAKTECLKFFAGTKSLAYFSDLTSNGIRPFKSDIEAGKLRHIVIMDLVRILSHSKGVGERTIQMMATLMEEGESLSSDAGGKVEWGNKFPTMGALMGITTSFYTGKAGSWRKTGFATRFLPVHFRYSTETVVEVHDMIRKGMKRPEPQPINLPANPRLVVIPDPIGQKIQIAAEALGIANNTYGFRYHRNIRCLIKAVALSNGRGLANGKDFEKVLPWVKFFTGKERVIL